MSDEANSEPREIPTAETGTAESEAKNKLAGKDVLTLLQRATELAAGNSRYAVDIAQKMSDQLWTAHKRVAELQSRVAELEAEVQLYRDKSDRAEAWLGKISSEIQVRVLGSSN